MYAEVYLRLEPLGLEIVAQSLRTAGHTVRLLDLQVFAPHQLPREIRDFRPDAVGFSLNYLANVPEVINMAKLARRMLPKAIIFLGGHSGSFIAHELFEHADGALDAMLLGEGETTAPALLANFPRIDNLPGIATPACPAPPRAASPSSLDDLRPARDLTRRRRRYFIGELDPCASIEFTRGCPWDCSFCSAWTFYGRSYRKASPEKIADEMASIREPNLFVVDDVAFVDAAHGHAIADALDRRGVRKRYYVETRCDTLIRNQEVFQRWAKLGLSTMFLGLESLDPEQLKAFRKRLTPNQSFQALDIARRLHIDVAINLITDPSWTREDFNRARDWATKVPEIVHLTVATPYPGTELFYKNERSLSATDYRLFDIQHAVLPTRLPLNEFYEELVSTQAIINRKFMGWRTAVACARIIAGQLIRGQTNFLRMLFKFSRVYNPKRQFADHNQPIEYHLRRPEEYPAAWRSGFSPQVDQLVTPRILRAQPQLS
jgi:magnesium-protoporphyrin IX monomethyl ester (oxidative) cyclase